jgi:hypothetical protein
MVMTVFVTGKIAPFEKQDGSLKPKFTAFTAFKEAVKASK